MTFAGGMVDIPKGCTAPAEAPYLVDGFAALIECGTDFDILVYGDVYMRDPCKGRPPGPKGTQAAPSAVVSRDGTPLPVCVAKRRDSSSKAEIEETLVDLGGAYFSARLRTPRHLSLLLQVARSFRRGENGNAK